MVAKNRKSLSSPRTTLRHVWLAGLGLAVVASRETAALPGRVLVGASRVQHDAVARLAEARNGMQGGLASARAQVEPTVVQFSSAVERRLAPVLVKFGLKPATKRARRATAKSAGKTTARKAPRQVVARKPAPARGKRRQHAA